MYYRVVKQTFFCYNSGMAKRTEDLSNWLSVPEAAKLAGITDQALRNAINRGRLHAEEKAGVKLIHRSEYDRWRKETKRGRPSITKEA